METENIASRRSNCSQYIFLQLAESYNRNSGGRRETNWKKAKWSQDSDVGIAELFNKISAREQQ